MKSEVINEAFIEIVPNDKLITDSVVLKEIDLRNCDINSSEINAQFSLTASKDGVLTSLVGYFDTFFDLTNSVHFSTGPESPKTHWQQTVFYLKDLIELKQGDKIDGVLTCTRLRKNNRGLSITIKIGDNKYQYVLD